MMNRYTRLDEEVELSNERYLDDVQSQQQVSHINSHTQLAPGFVVCVSDFKKSFFWTRAV